MDRPMVASWAVGIVALVYLSGTFAIAHLGDSVQRLAGYAGLRATIYALTLAVYCTSWTFYGSVGFAASNGYDYLAIYLGPVLVFGLGWRFVQRVARLRAHKISYRSPICRGSIWQKCPSRRCCRVDRRDWNDPLCASIESDFILAQNGA